MKLLSFDFETTCKEANNFGHPFDNRNKAVFLSCFNGERYNNFWFNHTEREHCEAGNVTCLFTSDDYLYVAFNAKFDMHWLRRETQRCFPINSIWCCQVAEMVLTRQQHKMPSLDEALARYGLEAKLNIVKTEYWDKGIDTDIIPAQIVEDYGSWDAHQTYVLAELQIAEAKERGLYNAIRMSCADLVVLAEMEWNGMLYDIQKSIMLAKDSEYQIKSLDDSLRAAIRDTLCIVSFDSPSNISSVLFGGLIKYNVPYVHVFKNGKSKVRQRQELMEFPRLIEPIKDSKLATENQYSTATDIIKLLKKKKISKFQDKLLDLLLERSKLEQLRGTYYLGIPKLFVEMNWQDNIIHHQLNQTVAVTGRLSSSKPNLQNQSEDSKQCFISRF